ncbi:MAG TPA: 30S ribosomal protein S16 [Candidatus Dormibacteraeota bacterium]|nr:30S ribosomal protein S16 [Candidatus Dormibacteraeota bacterium]
MVKIRLKRMGARKRPFYRLVVADARSPRDGRFIEELGTYDPIAKPARVSVDADRVREWMKMGAQPTDTARKLLEREQVLARSAAPVRAAAAPVAAPESADGEADAAAGAGEE